MKDIEPRQHAPSKEGVKREARHEHAVHELDDAGQDEEDEKGIDEFQARGRRVEVCIPEGIQRRLRCRRSCWGVGSCRR